MRAADGRAWPGREMMRHVLADAAPYLCCPLCRRDLVLTGPALGCAAGHRFDVARQGYASLLAGNARTGTADTAAMVAARHDFLQSGAYDGLTDAVADAVSAELVRGGAGGCIADVGGGTGHHLAAVLRRCPDRVGVCCDLSRYAARRAARAHPRIGAVVADVWRGVPVRDGAAGVVLDVFAPRNAAEFHRMLHPEGVLVLVTPQGDHLGELVDRLGLVSVDEDKPRRLRDALGARFDASGAQDLRWPMRLSRARVHSLVQMGPSAWHTDAADVDSLAEPVEVTAAVTVSTYRPREV